MDAWKQLAEIVALLGLALGLGVVARRLGQKGVIGYLLAGLIAGPRSLGLVRSLETVQFLAELGVALLLFGIGLEFSWQRISTFGRRSVLAGVLQISLTLGTGALIGNLLGLSAAGCVVLGGILALSSTAVVIRVLADRSEVDSRHGRIAIAILLLQDLALVPLLVLQSVLAEGLPGWAGVWQLGMQLGKGVALAAVFYVAVRLVLLRAFRGKDTYAERDVPIILSVLVCMGCAWASHLAGLSPVLGAFVAGMMLADQPVAEQIRSNVVPLQAVFLTLFFASIGMLAGIPNAPNLLRGVLLAALIITAKGVLAGLSVRMSGSPVRVAVLGGFAVAQIGEFSFVLAQDALRRNLLPGDWFDPLVLASVLTLLATPYLFPFSNWVVNQSSWSRLPAAARRTEARGERADVLVVGYGPAGAEVARALAGSGWRVTVIESNPALVAGVGLESVVMGDATSPEILAHAGVRRAKALVVTVPDPRVARMIVNLARSMAPEMMTIVRARYHRFLGELWRTGADDVVDEEFLVGKELAGLAVQKLEERRDAGNREDATFSPAP